MPFSFPLLLKPATRCTIANLIQLGLLTLFPSLKYVCTFDGHWDILGQSWYLPWWSDEYTDAQESDWDCSTYSVDPYETPVGWLVSISSSFSDIDEVSCFLYWCIYHKNTWCTDLSYCAKLRLESHHSSRIHTQEPQIHPLSSSYVAFKVCKGSGGGAVSSHCSSVWNPLNNGIDDRLKRWGLSY